jgi:hypothetical protein
LVHPHITQVAVALQQTGALKPQVVWVAAVLVAFQLQTLKVFLDRSILVAVVVVVLVHSLAATAALAS